MVSSVDTQPTAVIISIIFSLYFLFKRRKIDRDIFSILIITLATTILIDKDNLFLSLRGLSNYLSLSFITYATYECLSEKKISEKFIKFAINIWFLIGFIQTFIKSNFLESLISDMRTTPGRGVTALAPEPTFYAIICIFFIVIVNEMLTLKSDKKKYTINLIIQIFLFSKSSMGVLFLAILLLIYVVKNISFKILVQGIVIIIMAHFLIVNLFSDSRLANLYLRFSNPYKIFYDDYSMNQRLSHIFYSLKGSYENFFIPKGFVSWLEYSKNEALNRQYFHSFEASKRIMSGIGSMFFELGILGFYLSVKLFNILKKGLEEKVFTYFLFIIWFSAIPLGLPLIGFVLGVSVFKKRKINYNSFKNKGEIICQKK